MLFRSLMDDTLSGKFDLAICGVTITDARKEQALMSDGYLINGKTILCRKEDKDKFTSLEDINKPEVRVMVNPGGLNEKFARENLPDVKLIVHDVNQEIPSLIAEGEADIMITEIAEAGRTVALKCTEIRFLPEKSVRQLVLKVSRTHNTMASGPTAIIPIPGVWPENWMHSSTTFPRAESAF